MIKILSYVSKINKNNKEMKRISQELMKSIKFYYEEKENNIKYDEYYFNGLTISSKNKVNHHDTLTTRLLKFKSSN